jgi:hypothetical protein
MQAFEHDVIYEYISRRHNLKQVKSAKYRYVHNDVVLVMHQVNNGNDTHRLSTNLRSASENFEILLQKIQKEKNAAVPNFSLCLPLSPRGLQKQNLCRSNLRFLSFIFVPLY